MGPHAISFLGMVNNPFIKRWFDEMTIPIQIHFNFVKKIIFYIKILKRNDSDYQNGTMTGFILFSLWSYEKITLEK